MIQPPYTVDRSSTRLETVAGAGPSPGHRCRGRGGVRPGIVGILVLAGDTGIDEETGDFSRLPGVLLSALVVATGYFVLLAAPPWPPATAGTVAAGLGVPAFMFFVTFDENGSPPYNTEAILIVSTVAWLVTYSVGPARAVRSSSAPA